MSYIRLRQSVHGLETHTLQISSRYDLKRRKLGFFEERRPKGLTENAGRENDGPSKLQGTKLQDMKLMDQCAERKIAGRENDGPICTT